MGQKKILAVGVQLPDIESIPFESDRSLLDADIVFYYPCLNRRSSDDDSYYGPHHYSHADTQKVLRRIRHWQDELNAVLECGKLVIVMLARPLTSTGETRDLLNRSTEEFISSYLPLPKYPYPEVKQGNQMRLSDQAGFLKEYWKCFAHHSSYEVIIEGSFTRDLLTTKAGHRIVAAEIRQIGTMLLLPNLTCKGIPFGYWHTNEPKWTQEAKQFGQKLSSCLAGIYDDLLTKKTPTQPPNWATENQFAIEQEERIKEQVQEAEHDLERCQAHLTHLEELQANTGSIRALLYEQGKALETAVREALNAMGFEASGLAEGESEFDVVFHSAEGRCLGEVEGRNNAAIAIEKLTQLERNIHEDLLREEVETPAKGVLFGNAHRLIAPTERADFFTKKCLSSAKRTRVALVRTPDLFAPVCYLMSHPDAAYAETCRRAIIETEGEVVQFPEPPSMADRPVGPVPEAMLKERRLALTKTLTDAPTMESLGGVSAGE